MENKLRTAVCPTCANSFITMNMRQVFCSRKCKLKHKEVGRKRKVVKVQHVSPPAPQDAEKWKPLPSYEGLYEISNHGRVLSLRYGKFLNPFPSGKGNYLFVRLTKDMAGKSIPVHVHVAKLFVSNDSNKPQVNHKDTRKHNNHWKNLEWVTNTENWQHYQEMLKNGLYIGY